MRWATREGVHVDRAACAWLIRRFVDPAAELVPVTAPAEVPADATPWTHEFSRRELLGRGPA